MTFHPKAIFQRADKYDGVRPINIYRLRLLYIIRAWPGTPRPDSHKWVSAASRSSGGTQ
jgi:hypothetical protein